MSQLHPFIVSMRQKEQDVGIGCSGNYGDKDGPKRGASVNGKVVVKGKFI